MRQYLRGRYGRNGLPAPVWIGASIENNAYAWRAEMLREVKATIRFLSLEPLLGPVDAVSFEGIGWVIAGGESGPSLRPMDVAWVRDIRNRCITSGIPFFFKPWHKKNTGRRLDDRLWSQFPKTQRLPIEQSTTGVTPQARF